MRVVIGISGASGSIYGVRLFQKLQEAGNEVELIITDYGKEVLKLDQKGKSSQGGKTEIGKK